jgi:hypothetical protein
MNNDHKNHGFPLTSVRMVSLIIGVFKRKNILTLIEVVLVKIMKDGFFLFEQLPTLFILQFMDMRGKTTDYTFSHFLVELLDEKDPDVTKWIETMDNVTRCRNINIKALVTEIEGTIFKYI